MPVSAMARSTETINTRKHILSSTGDSQIKRSVISAYHEVTRAQCLLCSIQPLVDEL